MKLTVIFLSLQTYKKNIKMKANIYSFQNCFRHLKPPWYMYTQWPLKHSISYRFFPTLLEKKSSEKKREREKTRVLSSNIYFKEDILLILLSYWNNKQTMTSKMVSSDYYSYVR